jgi:hypothetical protein
LKALVDGDVMCYRAAYACKDEKASVACLTLDGIVTEALLSCDYADRWYDQWQIYLTGKTNFRNDIAKTAVYKGNRANKPKPPHLPAVRKHFQKHWGAIVVEGEEADDAIAIEATALQGRSVIISIDKDFMQVPGHVYNFVKREHHIIDEQQGLFNFFKQILTGDTADNIIGIKGIGDVKATKLLQECISVEEMYDTCVAMYNITGVDGEARVLENGQLLWLRREKGQIWTPSLLSV